MGLYGSPDTGNLYTDEPNYNHNKHKNKPFYKSILLWIIIIADMFIALLAGISSENIMGIIAIDCIIVFITSLLKIVYKIFKGKKIWNNLIAISGSVVIFLISGALMGNIPTQTGDNFSISDYKRQCEEVTYSEIAREPEKYKNKRLKFNGQIVQVQDNGSNIMLRVNVTKGEFDFYEDTILVNYSYSAKEKRLLEGDVINLWGESKGIVSYTSIFGSKITVPSINAKIIEISKGYEDTYSSINDAGTISSSLEKKDSVIIDMNIADVVELDDIMIKVVGVDEKKSLSSGFGSTIDAKEDAKFIIIDLEVTNVTKKPFTLNPEYTILDDKEREFNPYTEGIFYIDNYINYRELAPGIKEIGLIVYELPEDANSYSLLFSRNNGNELYSVLLK